MKKLKSKFKKTLKSLIKKKKSFMTLKRKTKQYFQAGTRTTLLPMVVKTSIMILTGM